MARWFYLTLCVLFLLGIGADAEAETLFVIGNSLAHHPERQSIGWKFNHGMAASSPERDYVHILQSRLRKATDKEYDLVITPMRNESHMAALPERMPEQADVIILQVGDNYKNTLDEATLKTRYAGMLTTLEQRYPKSIVIAVGPWKAGNNEEYRQAAAAAGVPFASIRHLGGNPAMSASGYSSWAVNWHPGDKGMAAIADVIWGALKKELARPAKAPVGVTGIVPEPQEAVVCGKPDFTWKPGTTLYAPRNPGAVLKRGIELLTNDFRELRRLDLPVKYDLPSGTTELRLSPNPDFSAKSVPPDKGYDAYALNVEPEGIELVAHTEAGLFYGIQTLRQLFRPAGNAPTIAICDWAAQRWRVVYGMPWETSAFLDKLARLKINMCIVESPWNAARNWWFNPSPGNRAKAEELFRLAAQNNIEIVPLVQGGGWAYGVIDQNPDCAEGIWVPKAPVSFTSDTVDFPERNVIRTPKMPVIISDADGKTVYSEGRDYEIIPGITRRPFLSDNAPWKLRRLAKGAIPPGTTVNVDYNYMNLSRHQTPYCPQEPQTYEILDRTLRSVIENYRPRFIHIGHDEVIYRNRCRRCVQSGKTAAELAGEDLRWWYEKIKAIDPTITIMIWDDLVRAEEDGPAVLNYLPKDVIICPWAYAGNDKEKKRIDGRTAWFLGKNHRPTLGTSSGYFHENSILWRDSLRPYRNDPHCLGFMFSHWGESIGLWGALPYAAQLMWSPERLNPEELRSLYWADYTINRFGWRAAMEFDLQRAALSKKVNAGDCDLDKVESTVAEQITAINRYRLPGFSVADNPFPEDAASQLKRLTAWYRAMLAYRDLLTAPNQKTAEVLFASLEQAAPEQRAKWEDARIRYRKEEILPPSQELFGVEIKASSPYTLNGRLYPVSPARVVNNPGIREVEFNGAVELGQVEFTSAAPGMYRVVAIAPDGGEKTCFETIIGDSGSAVGNWKPFKVIKVRIHSNEPKEPIGAKIEFKGLKPPARLDRAGEVASAAEFVTQDGALAQWPTQAGMRIENGNLAVEFNCIDKPGRKPVTNNNALWEDDCAEFFLREHPDQPGFVHVVVNADGQSTVLLHDRANPVPKVQVAVKKSRTGWGCEICIPLAELQGKPEQWAVNFGRNYPGVETSSWAELPNASAFWFHQPRAFIPTPGTKEK